MFRRGPLPSDTWRYPKNENAQVTPILPVADLSRATDFYRDKLGLKDLSDDANGQRLLQTGAGSTIGLMPAEEGAQTAHPLLTFEVENITDEVKDQRDLPGYRGCKW